MAKLYFNTMVGVAQEQGKTRIEFPFDSDGTLVAHTWGMDKKYHADNSQNSNLEFFGHFLSAIKDSNALPEPPVEARAHVVSNQWGSAGCARQ